jgi:hypothetical protein
MGGAIRPLPQDAFMTWCSVKAQGQLYLYFLPCSDTPSISVLNLVCVQTKRHIHKNQSFTEETGTKCPELNVNGF